jgi:hypothetical protein
VYRGLVREAALGYCCSTLSSSYSALSVHTSTTILLDLAQMFLELEMTVHVLGNVVVSVLLLIVELLRSVACSHLVSLPLNVGLADLESVVPIVSDELGHVILYSFLVSAAFTIWSPSSIYLYTLFFLGKPHVHVGLGGGDGDGVVVLLLVDSKGDSSNSPSSLVVMVMMASTSSL